MIVAARRVSAVAHESTDEVQGARCRNWHRTARKVIATERISSPAPTAVARYQRPTLDHKTEAKIVAQGLAEGGGVLTLTLTTTTVCFAAGIDSPLTVIRQFSLMQTLIMLAYCTLSKFIPHVIVFLLSLTLLFNQLLPLTTECLLLHSARGLCAIDGHDSP